ncbi:MAG: hypothetical protein EOM62_15925, partial [Bacteroidia bacterium]|nr:hypothetical protein [Bacteroidia bacterium]
MKIVTSTGDAFDMDPGMVIEIDRPNVFFNESGEMSLPVKLPPTERNFKILGNPESTAKRTKSNNRINVSIRTGMFHLTGRMAVLSANRKTGIEASFYLNTGAFYEKFKDIRLSEIFASKAIKFTSVMDAITFCKNLMVTPDPRFACFPVSIYSAEQQTTSLMLNQRTTELAADGYYRMYNDVDRKETVDGKSVSISAGFYVSPFIRANHLLSEVMAYMGYTVNPNFFTFTDPFPNMVFLNNNIDTIVKAEIRYDQIVPDLSVSDLLTLFRNKFCCEFIPDEITKSVDIVLFKDVMAEQASADLSSNLVGYVTPNYAENMRRLKITSSVMPYLSFKWDDADSTFKRIVVDPTSDSISLAEMLSSYPDVEFDKIDGSIYRIGFQGAERMKIKLGTISCNYDSLGELEVEEKTCPDKLVTMDGFPGLFLYPFAGNARAINSTVVFDKAENSAAAGDNQPEKLDAMLCFCIHNPADKYDSGTVYNYNLAGTRLWDYSLAPCGPDGLFEKFWRDYDTLLRNSLNRVNAELLLTDTDKVSLEGHKKVIINNQEYLPDVITYPINANVPMECSFLTTQIYDPEDNAPAETSRFEQSPYYWEPMSIKTPSGYA